MPVPIYIARLRKPIVLGLTFAALAAPSAQASRLVVPDAIDRYLANQRSHVLAPDDRPGMRAIGSVSSVPDAIDRYLANQRSHVLAPDDRVRMRVPDSIDRYMANLERRSAATSSTPGDGFDWNDAGVGAVSLSVVVLLTISGLLLVMRRRQHA